MAVLNLEQIERHLETSFIGRVSGCPNELWDSIDSTNTRAAQLAATMPAEGAIVMAREQTAGRGRLGRTWISRPDTGVYMSIILRPQTRPLNELSLLTMACGVAVAEAIDAVAGVSIGLKWVNDLIFDGRKIGGILAETTGRAPAYVIIGIGLNVALDLSTVEDDLKERVDSLDRIAGAEIDSNQLVCAIAEKLEQHYKSLLQSQDEVILNQWRKRTVTLGQRVIATSGARNISGVAYDVNSSGALIIQCDDGHEEAVNAGEVQIRRHDGAYC
ncbi:MAG: biotin--[acetyl-CoA-carboxylase] ligase [Candidatus Obscuribacterales bacterium]|nr:biotin--[acetyl-CoA-carboxylase] ligase [Candidatus Obscuribacterales bacterium]